MEQKASQVVLLGKWTSGQCSRVALALKLKGIPYKYVEQDLTNKSELLLKNNPVHQKVPVLLHSGKPIAESLVILEYIDETWNHTPKLLPHDPYQRAKVRFWVNYFDQKIATAIYPVFRSKGEEREKEIEKMNEIIGVFIEGLKKDFGKEEFTYSKGKCLGLLDIVVGTQACNYKAVQEALKVEAIHPHTNSEFLSWVDSLKEHPLMKETLPPHDKLVASFIDKFGLLN
ncbi:glutathione S-transferase U10-like [Prosopis cineraria]|uniref:glutathione S-transferase U10-like n=1 Tax=Prosopis cineraria TaxID=364024 RepID=UPI0024101EC0|nr:glutathione S-transferase U10-like [Prosopis cineraria]